MKYGVCNMLCVYMEHSTHAEAKPTTQVGFPYIQLVQATRWGHFRAERGAPRPFFEHVNCTHRLHDSVLQGTSYLWYHRADMVYALNIHTTIAERPQNFGSNSSGS